MKASLRIRLDVPNEKGDELSIIIDHLVDAMDKAKRDKALKGYEIRDYNSRMRAGGSLA